MKLNPAAIGLDINALKVLMFYEITHPSIHAQLDNRTRQHVRTSKHEFTQTSYRCDDDLLQVHPHWPGYRA